MWNLSGQCVFDPELWYFFHVPLHQTLSNDEQVVVIHARTVLTLAEKVANMSPCQPSPMAHAVPAC